MNQILKDAYNQFAYLQEPLEWDDKRRVDLSQHHVRGTGLSPARYLKSNIELSASATCQLFTGFMGSGKSTELLALSKEFGDAGYDVVYIDSEDFLNLSVPTSINQVLIALAGGFDEYLQALQGQAVTQVKRFWERLRTFLDTEIQVEEVGIKLPASAEMKLTFKSDAVFRQELEKALEGRLTPLAVQCQAFINEALAGIRSAHPKSAGTIVIFDSFEKLKGSFSNARTVRESVENVFVKDREFLRLNCHAIYTVPPWIAFLDIAPAADFGKAQPLPMCKLTHQESGNEDKDGINAMFALLAKRADLTTLFEDHEKVLKPVIKSSGGYPRHLLQLMCDILVHVHAYGLELPVPAKEARKVIKEVVGKHVQVFEDALCEEDLAFLMKVAADQGIASYDREDVHHMARLFDHHFILCYRNGKPWYDLHPMVRQAKKFKAACEARADEREETESGA